MGDGATLRLTANLSATNIVRPAEATGRSIWGGEPAQILPPWSVFWRIES
jgi:maltooligosyltrehalose trehalohydrolase